MNSKPRVSAPIDVEREPVRVMFLRATEDSPPAIGHAWKEFETAVGLKGRKFFGAFENELREYRVCTAIQADDDPAAMGFDSDTLPGGTYSRVRLRGEPPDVYAYILPTVEGMEQQPGFDTSRPTIEFYRSHDIIDILVPVNRG